MMLTCLSWLILALKIIFGLFGLRFFLIVLWLTCNYYFRAKPLALRYKKQGVGLLDGWDTPVLGNALIHGAYLKHLANSPERDNMRGWFLRTKLYKNDTIDIDDSVHHPVALMNILGITELTIQDADIMKEILTTKNQLVDKDAKPQEK